MLQGDCVDLEAPVAVTFDSAAAAPVALGCTLRYTTTDPYAVHLCFPRTDTGGRQVVWSFSRELLAEGVHEPVGLGDVRLRPAGGGRTRLTLRGSTGDAELILCTRQVDAFLKRTEEAVPVGAESDLIDWDHLAEQLSSQIP
jgi:hypothetical protein